MTRLEIMADYFQIYVCDPEYIGDWSALWTDQTVKDRMVALPHTIVFGTGRNMPVPVDVVVHKQQPDLTALIAPADHAVRTAQGGRMYRLPAGCICAFDLAGTLWCRIPLIRPKHDRPARWP
jgi:hypothetical protein